VGGGWSGKGRGERWSVRVHKEVGKGLQWKMYHFVSREPLRFNHEHMVLT